MYKMWFVVGLLIMSGCSANKVLPRVSLSYNEVASASTSNKFNGATVKWRGVINTKASQLDGIKFYILDDDHQSNAWEDYEWFWAIPNYEPTIDETQGRWAHFMLQKYGGIDSAQINWGEDIFQVEGKIYDNDCDFYDESIFNKQVCIPNVQVTNIKKN